MWLDWENQQEDECLSDLPESEGNHCNPKKVQYIHTSWDINEHGSNDFDYILKNTLSLLNDRKVWVVCIHQSGEIIKRWKIRNMVTKRILCQWIRSVWQLICGFCVFACVRLVVFLIFLQELANICSVSYLFSVVQVLRLLRTSCISALKCLSKSYTVFIIPVFFFCMIFIYIGVKWFCCQKLCVQYSTIYYL